MQNSLPPNIHENQKYCDLFHELNACVSLVMLLGAKQVALCSPGTTALQPILYKL